MHEYYAKQHVRPTYADFSDDAELSRYAEMRKTVFFRLTLPPALFAGARVLEIGPDTGENSLVFAQWGARLTLVEPNADAHTYIRRYFSKFGLEDRLDDLVASSLLEFASSGKYDVVDAEGFIYTVQPTEAWIAKMAEWLKPGGYAVVTYMEFFGSFIELLLKAIYKRVARDEIRPGVETARRLFLPKWDSIPHTRKFESWFMDVIENPFVRMKYFIEPAGLLRDMRAGGFRLYSSWPGYKDALGVEWIKKPDDEAAELEASTAFAGQNRLAHMLGRKCYLPVPSTELSDATNALVRITDGLVDNPSGIACRDGIKEVDSIQSVLRSFGDRGSNHDIESALGTLRMVGLAFELMADGSVQELVEFCRTDDVFLATWGMPNHYAVFQRAPGRSGAGAAPTF